MRETCPTCGLTWCPDEPEDRREHSRHCARWRRATEAIGYAPAHWREREAAKADGHRLAWEAPTLAGRVAGAECVLRAWFDRSLGAAISGNYWQRHPDFAAYVAMMDVPHAFAPEVWTELRARYGRIAGEVAAGYSCWEPSSTRRGVR